MAIYHLSGQILSRNQGRSSVAASAYRSGEKLLDERTGLWHDFSHKSDVVEKAILLPQGAPERWLDRERLWNDVEHTEKRKDAQVAREFNIALPKELTPEQNWVLAKAYVQREFVDRGMIADVAMHAGHKGTQDQPHIHVMLTMRDVSPEGFGQKNRSWNDKALLQHWRESWAEHVNRALARLGLDQRIDHRTLSAQGIDLEPQSKIGPKPAQVHCVRYAEHQALAQRNGERLWNDPTIALDAITKQQSTFTHHDLAKFVHRHTAGSEQFEQVYAKVKGHDDVVALGIDTAGLERYTTSSMLAMEQRMMGQTMDKTRLSSYPVSSARLESAIASRTLSSEQVAMLRHVTDGPDVVCVVGVAGTGKSYTLDAAREVWEGYTVKGMALSGKAAEELEASSGINSRTVASFEHFWDQDRDRLTAKDIVVVDEAGMLGSRQMARIVEETAKAKAKLVLVGDPEQLQAIEAGAAFRAITEKVGFVELAEVRRQQVDWQRQATQAFAKAQTEQGLAAYQAHDCVHGFDTQDAAKAAMVDRWQEMRSQEPDKTQLMLAYTRADVKDLNDQARRIREDNGELGDSQVFEVHRFTEREGRIVIESSERAFAVNDKIYFLKNDRELGVKNGTLGTVTGIDQDKLTVSIDRTDRQVEVNTQYYKHLDHGYATTVHKSQAGTYDRTHVLASKYFDRHTTYVAMSRHRLSAELYWSRDAFKDERAMTGTMSRAQLKDTSLDYQRQEYAERRGFEVEKPSMTIDSSLLRSKEVTDRQVASQDPFDQLREQARKKREQSPEYQRARAAHDRLKQQELRQLETKDGRSYSMEVNAGDKGIYRGDVTIAHQRYGVLEIDSRTSKLVPIDMVRSREKGQEMTIEKQSDLRGQERLRAVQEKQHERERERGGRER